MSTILLKDIPRKCPNCGAHIFAAAPRPKIAKKSWFIAAIGVAATALWVVLFFTFSDYYISPRGIGGIALCALIYGWPFYLSALIIWKMPMEVIAKCFKCKEVKTYKIALPKM